MNSDRSPHNTADQYLQLFANDEAMHVSLLACSAGLSLDDGVASDAIEVVLPQAVQTQDILARIKRLGCVSHNWDGSWRISEDVRVGLADLLSRQFSADRLLEIRTRLASKAERKASSLSPDGQITNYRVREARFQAAYQKLLMPGRAEEGAQLCAEIWRQASADAREATCSAADYVSDEVLRQVEELPPELLFLKGMAARARGDRDGAKEYFRLVWKQGRPGDIFAIAAHLFGNLSSDRELAERAFRDSLQWYDDRSHQGQVWHSLGNLLSRQSPRWKEAEEAYRKSLQLRHDPAHQGQVYSSWAGAIVDNRPVNEYDKAEEYVRLSLSLRPNERTQSTVNGILARLYEAKGQYGQAVAALSAAIEADKRLKNSKLVRQRQQHLEELRRKI